MGCVTTTIDGDGLEEAVRLVGERSGRDITVYDRVFLAKTLSARMTAGGFASLPRYVECLGGSETERTAFVEALNITHSEFFRDPLAFAVLERHVLPVLVARKEKAGGGMIRVWSAGCASGQEPYSVAILLEELTGRRNSVDFHIVATDRSESELAPARAGAYGPDDVRNVRLGLFKRYFVSTGEFCLIDERIRRQVDFAEYDLLENRTMSPPAGLFGDYDLVLCCNQLFYYRPDIRARIMEKIGRALDPDGYLMTGEAEGEIVVEGGQYRYIVPAYPVFRKAGTP